LLLKKYQALAAKESKVTFVGRLGQYRYYNMDQCVGAALKTADEIANVMAPRASLKTVAKPAVAAAQQARAGS
jgi:UDP-galactopyranose mutase